jgi:3-hydroxyacyl-CoA dehydrogenase / 3-hydroxy-2-methylbutyryl-CoA dehydrogenase
MIKNELKERVLTTKCDVTKESDVKEAIELTVATFGALHVSLACAGVAWPTMTLSSKGSLDMKIFETEVKINLLGSAYVAKYSAVAMSKNTAVNERGEKGLILFVSSVAAEEGQRG